MSRDCGNLRKLHPIPIFDDNVQFFDYCVVNRISQRLHRGVEIDHHTGKLLPGQILPVHCEIANHKYFLNGIPVRGSVTALSDRYFSKFDADGQSTRIAYEESRCLNQPEYKYFHRKFPRSYDEVVKRWSRMRAASQHKDILYETPGRHYAEAEQNFQYSSDIAMGYYLAFRTIHDPIMKECLIRAWEENRDLAGEKGTEMHLAIQLWYEKQFTAETPGGNTKPFKQFLKFHDEWVVARKLRMLRPEISMYDPYSQLNGTIDAVFIVEKSEPIDPDEPIDVVLADWKRTENVATTSFKKDAPEFGYPPFADWQLCKTSERWLQLLIYAKIFTENTGGKYRVVSAHIVAFHDNLDDYSVQDVPINDPSIADRMRIVFDEQHVAKKTALMQEMVELLQKQEKFDKTTDKEIVKGIEVRLRDINKLLKILNDAAVAKRQLEEELEEQAMKKRRVSKKTKKALIEEEEEL